MVLTRRKLLVPLATFARQAQSGPLNFHAFPAPSAQPQERLNPPIALSVHQASTALWERRLPLRVLPTRLAQIAKQSQTLLRMFAVTELTQ